MRNVRNIRQFIRHPSQCRWLNSDALLRIQESTNAFVTFNDKCTSAGGNAHRGPLSGISVAVKDNICTKDLKTTCSSAMLRDFQSPYDATVVRLLQTAGVHIVGKTNCDEFGMGSHNIHTIHGPVVNPYRSSPSDDDVSTLEEEKRSAGGSSGGSAAAVASNACHAALSTDTGGSTRLPAAYCGIAGFKPSYGLISRWGVVSYADSLDCVGIMAKTTEQIQPIFELLSVFDPKDPTSASVKIREKSDELCQQALHSLPLSTTKSLDGPLTGLLKGLVIGIPQEYFPKELDPSTLSALSNLIQHLRSAGATVLPVSLPSTPYALSAYYVIASAEATSNLARYSGIHYGLRVTPPAEADKTIVSNVYAHTRSKGFGKEVQKRILLGTYALTADAFDNYFLQAQRVRKLVKQDFGRVFKAADPLSSSLPSSMGQVDILIHPSAVGVAPPLSSLTNANSSSLDAYVQDVLTVPSSLAGLPALSVPVGYGAGYANGRDKWPLGVSIVGQWGYDKLVLEVGRAVEHLSSLSSRS